MEEYDDIIDAYLRNELSEGERLRFEKQIKSNANLRTKFTEVYEIRQALKIEALKNKMDQYKGFENKIRNQESGFWHKNKFLIIGIALLLLATLAYFFLITEKSPPSAEPTASAQYAHHFDDERNFEELIYNTTIRSVTNPGEFTKEQKKAFDLYKVQEFDKAIPLLKDLWETQNDTLAYYYLGVSYLGTGKNQEASEILYKDFLNIYKNPMEE